MAEHQAYILRVEGSNPSGPTDSLWAYSREVEGVSGRALAKERFSLPDYFQIMLSAAGKIRIFGQ